VHDREEGLEGRGLRNVEGGGLREEG